MRHLTVFGALTALALTSPALARDGSGYVGFDAGLLMPDDTEFEFDGDDVFGIEHKNGFDIDLIAGYDFGFIRAEGELGWKRATHDNLFGDEEEFDGDGDADVRSAMINVFGDIGSDRWSFYAGGGVGYALVQHSFEGFDNIFEDDDELKLKDGGFAWQGIAGVRYAMNEMIDIGLKYRYFDTGEFNDSDVEWDFTSHSLMFSFIYNMGGERRVEPPPPPPPPLPPPPPATQTCPDGSVILATDICPPPPPPPPPLPEPERG